MSAVIISLSGQECGTLGKLEFQVHGIPCPLLVSGTWNVMVPEICGESNAVYLKAACQNITVVKFSMSDVGICGYQSRIGSDHVLETCDV